MDRPALQRLLADSDRFRDLRTVDRGPESALARYARTQHIINRLNQPVNRITIGIRPRFPNDIVPIRGTQPDLLALLLGVAQRLVELDNAANNPPPDATAGPDNATENRGEAQSSASRSLYPS
jgi:hypothetical protein